MITGADIYRMLFAIVRRAHVEGVKEATGSVFGRYVCFINEKDDIAIKLPLKTYRVEVLFDAKTDTVDDVVDKLVEATKIQNNKIIGNRTDVKNIIVHQLCDWQFLPDMYNNVIHKDISGKNKVILTKYALALDKGRRIVDTED